MNEVIMKWSSANMYNDKLCAHSSVAQHSVQDIVASAEIAPLLYIDTAGCLMHELVEESSSGISESKSNVGEADLVIQVVKELKQMGLSE